MVEVRRRVTIPADLERLAELRAIVREVVDDCDAPADCSGDLVQAVDEAATNIIRYGYRGGPGEIELTAELVGDDIIVTLEDRAPMFDPTAVPSPDLSIPPQHRKPGGMGIHLMRLATDSIEHRPRPGGGNILTLTRSRARRAKEG
jgi:anti-sigma regulatory factor (Ser/Thr protein kinase)